MKTPPGKRSFGSVGSAGGSALANAAAGNGGHKKTSSTDASSNSASNANGSAREGIPAADPGPATPRSGGLGGIGAGVFSALMSGVNPFASASKTSASKDGEGKAASSPSSSNASPATPTPASTAAAVAASASASASATPHLSTTAASSGTMEAATTMQKQTQTPHVPAAILVPPPPSQGPGVTTPTTAKRVSFPPQQPRTPVTPTTPMSSGSTNSSNPSAHHPLGGLDDDGAPRPSSSRPAPQSPALSRRTSLARSERRMSAQLAGAEGHAHSHSPSLGGGHSQRNSLQLARSPSRGSSAHGHGSGAGGSGSGSGAGSRRTSRVLAGARHRLSQSVSAADVEREGEGGFVDAPEESPLQAVPSSGVDAAAASTSTNTGTGTSKRAPITIRDFAFAPADVRHAGLGPDVPPPCDPARLARRLRGDVRMSDYGAPDDEDGDDDDDGLNGWGGGGFTFGKGRMSFGGSSLGGGSGDGDGVSAADFARNFGDGEFGDDDDSDDDDDGGLLYTDRPGDEDEDELYYAESYADVAPGLYRAQFAFAAIDRAEMDLVEGQLIYVLGSGGDGTDGTEGEDGGANAGAGWAVARDREPPLVMKEADVLEVNAMVGARTDAGRVWEELWAAAAEAAGAASASAPAADPPPPAERRALVPDSYIVLIRGEGEREADAHARLVRYLEWVEKERVRQLEEAEEAAGSGAAGKGGEEEEEDEEEGVFEDAQAGDERGQLQA
ncbi:hypothetical protein C8F04DRAFT_1191959 [Mycena alexandri]|uniref:Uncharacterized protein n=1 Tax=Mycena alexandri TaxID=1745969 RepID=A0AAD6SG89_9AGAR|nr:hypothetical protein C8F04DRAFT_1191959 [Mycena alexandri]